ncbi:MAG: hypothetical protein LQ351_007537 [Letrouitia transgressa]|nr:MAG: hypothetical protein LQ351_007537 [Letrouitia transgressa]
MQAQDVDLVVVGAGRSYEDFWTQWTVGTAEWSDKPMSRPPEDDIYYEFFKAKHTTNYLEKYVDEHFYAGHSLRDRIYFNAIVKSIEKSCSKWIITSDTADYQASKVIVAHGLTSIANIPDWLGRQSFEGPIIHQEDFGQSFVLSSPSLQNITVVGGGKSAADMVYASVKAGKSVSWVIRASGTCPGFLLSPKGKGPYKNASEIGSTRIAGTFSPSVLSPDTWWTRFLHRTKIGQKVTNAIWDGADQGTCEDANFNGRQNALEGFVNLKPHTPLFWQNCAGGLLNRADFWDTIAPNVHVYFDDIVKVEHKLVRLQKGQDIPTDAILCGTGWKTADFDFFKPQDLVKLGLPHQFSDEPADQLELWAQLEKQAEPAIIRNFPVLANQPKHHHKPLHTTPYRLYNGIAPLNDNTIVFVGYFLVGNYFKGAECQAIWATAFLDGKLELPTREERQIEIARLNTWCRKRYLSNGELGNMVVSESNFYTDKLLKEVGLSSHLKGWFNDYFRPGTAQDMAGLKEEYLARYGGGENQK